MVTMMGSELLRQARRAQRARMKGLTTMPRGGPERPYVIFRLAQGELDDLNRRVAAENVELAERLGVPVDELREATGKITRSSKIRDWIAIGRATEDRKAARKLAKVGAR